jgi:hypothetical protein
MTAALTRALGVPVAWETVSPDEYRALGFPGADDIGNMFQFGAEFEEVWAGARDVARTRHLYPGLQSFETWLERNASRIPLSAGVA